MSKRKTPAGAHTTGPAKPSSALEGELLELNALLTMGQLCECCGLEAEHVVALVQEGIIEAKGPDQSRWTFQVSSIRRVRTARRLQRDLGVNLAGAALALELLDRLTELKNRQH